MRKMGEETTPACFPYLCHCRCSVDPRSSCYSYNPLFTPIREGHWDLGREPRTYQEAFVRTRFNLAGVIILLLTFSVSSYSQQTGAARRGLDAPATAGARSTANTRVTGTVVKSDVNEALS